MNSLIRPAYLTQPKDNFVSLGMAPIQIACKQKTLHATGQAFLRLQPHFLLTVNAKFKDFAVGLFAADTVDMKYGSGFESAKATVINLQIGDTGGSEAELMPNPQRLVFLSESNPPLSSVTFHIVNFPKFISVGDGSQDLRHQVDTGGWKRLGRVVLVSAPWHIEIQELPDTSERIDQLKQAGGFGLTHVGRLTRNDGRNFTVSDAEIVIQNLYLFMSFARGAWTPTVLCVGYDADGFKAFEDWGVRIGTPWESRQGWFDTNHANCLADLYAGFQSLIHASDLGKAVSNSLYWYLRSNRGGEGAGIDSGIILSQAALERLSTAYLRANAVSTAKSANAAHLLRETLLRLQIPASIPDALVSLRENQSYWKDGPEAVTKVRNELVHPEKRLPIKLQGVISDTWRLAQWYIELIVLRLSNYEGDYSNRLKARWVGEVEKVPWHSSE